MNSEQSNLWATTNYHMACGQFKNITHRKEGCGGHHYLIKL